MVRPVEKFSETALRGRWPRLEYMTLAELAVWLGLSVTSVQRWARGHLPGGVDPFPPGLGRAFPPKGHDKGRRAWRAESVLEWLRRTGRLTP